MSEETIRTDVYHAARGGQHAPAELKFVPNKARQAAIASSAPGSFNRANGQPLRDYCISGIRTLPYDIGRNDFGRYKIGRQYVREDVTLAQGKRNCIKWQLCGLIRLAEREILRPLMQSQRGPDLQLSSG